MSLEDTILNIGETIANNPGTFFLDIGNHLLSGIFVAERYFPKASMIKKGMLSMFAAFAPDMDYLTLGALPHRSVTHTLEWAGGITAGMGIVDGVSSKQGLLNGLKKAVNSNYAKLTGIGVGLHLLVDSLKDPMQMVGYCAIMAGGIMWQKRINNSYLQTHKSLYTVD